MMCGLQKVAVRQSSNQPHPHLVIATVALRRNLSLPQVGSNQCGHWLRPIRLRLMHRLDWSSQREKSTQQKNKRPVRFHETRFKPIESRLTTIVHVVFQWNRDFGVSHCESRRMFSNVYLWYGVVSNGSKSICIDGVHLRFLGQCGTRPKDRLGSWGTSCSAYYGFDCNDYLRRVGITSLWLHLHRYRHRILQLKTR